jgi:hypothetical protein
LLNQGYAIANKKEVNQTVPIDKAQETANELMQD